MDQQIKQEPPAKQFEKLPLAPLSNDGKGYWHPETPEQWAKLYASGARPKGYWRTHNAPPAHPESMEFE